MAKHWKQVHKTSGATVIERSTASCKLSVMPRDWTKPRGAASWTATCGESHKRGSSNTVKNAKSAATRAAKKMRR